MSVGLVRRWRPAQARFRYQCYARADVIRRLHQHPRLAAAPAAALPVTKKLDIHWCWIKCTRCPHMRSVAIAPYVIR